MKRHVLLAVLTGLGVVSLLPADRAQSAWTLTCQVPIQTSPPAGFNNIIKASASGYFPAPATSCPRSRAG